MTKDLEDPTENIRKSMRIAQEREVFSCVLRGTLISMKGELLMIQNRYSHAFIKAWNANNTGVNVE